MEHLPRMSGSEARVMIALLQRRNTDTGRCDPAIPTIMADTGIGRKHTVCEALRKLAARGLLKWSEAITNAGRHNSYDIAGLDFTYRRPSEGVVTKTATTPTSAETGGSDEKSHYARQGEPRGWCRKEPPPIVTETATTGSDEKSHPNVEEQEQEEPERRGRESAATPHGGPEARTPSSSSEGPGGDTANLMMPDITSPDLEEPKPESMTQDQAPRFKPTFTPIHLSLVEYPPEPLDEWGYPVFEQEEPELSPWAQNRFSELLAEDALRDADEPAPQPAGPPKQPEQTQAKEAEEDTPPPAPKAKVKPRKVKPKKPAARGSRQRLTDDQKLKITSHFTYFWAWVLYGSPALEVKQQRDLLKLKPSNLHWCPKEVTQDGKFLEHHPKADATDAQVAGFILTQIAFHRYHFGKPFKSLPDIGRLIGKVKNTRQWMTTADIVRAVETMTESETYWNGMKEQMGRSDYVANLELDESSWADRPVLKEALKLADELERSLAA
ncbi:MAG: helix-turn-helix domain-containing protein [Planctomycetota bacterium]